MNIPMLGTAVAALILVACALPAAADESAGDTLDVLAEVAASSDEAAADVLANVVDVPTDDTGGRAIDSTIGDVDVVVPTDPAEPIELTAPDISIGLTLPFSTEAETAEVVRNGVVSYDNDNGSATVPVVKDDGSVQVTTIIDDATAPTSYAYELTLDPGSSLTLQEDGMVAIRTGDGTLAGGVAPAWAVDAEGADVATHYEVTGSTLVQVVEHTGGDVAYPVTADPYFGFKLISSGEWVSNYSGESLQITPTVWGRINGLNPTAWESLESEYCGEFEIGCTDQMWWQLKCHAQFAPLKATWNLDAWRSRPAYWQYILNGCN